MGKNNWIYLGIFICPLTQKRNLLALKENNVIIPEGWKMFNHHMTLAFNNGSETANMIYDTYKHYFGESIDIFVDGIGISDDAIALRVQYWANPIMNKIPHITIATPPNGKPVNSNKITEWFDIEPYRIRGKIGEFLKTK